MIRHTCFRRDNDRGVVEEKSHQYQYRLKTFLFTLFDSFALCLSTVYLLIPFGILNQFNKLWDPGKCCDIEVIGVQ